MSTTFDLGMVVAAIFFAARHIGAVQRVLSDNQGYCRLRASHLYALKSQIASVVCSSSFVVADSPCLEIMTHTKEGHRYDNTGIHKGLETDAVVSSTVNTKSSYDVIVIGSGFCGLVAARNLALDRNLRVLLLEARDRIGGRTWTAKAWGEEFEMGGTYVHWYLHMPVCIAGENSADPLS